jgi:hypothetical protein
MFLHDFLSTFLTTNHTKRHEKFSEFSVLSVDTKWVVGASPRQVFSCFSCFSWLKTFLDAIYLEVIQKPGRRSTSYFRIVPFPGLATIGRVCFGEFCRHSW